MGPDDMSFSENWSGGFYELVLELGPADDARLDRAVRALWRAADVRGCRPEHDQPDVEPSADALLAAGHLRGTVTLPSRARVVCGGFASRFEDDDTDELELYLPLGALTRVDRRIRAFPFDEHSGAESLQWREPLDRWLADVAGAVHAEVPLRRALIGFEVDERSTAGGYDAILTPGPTGLKYRPATA